MTAIRSLQSLARRVRILLGDELEEDTSIRTELEHEVRNATQRWKEARTAYDEADPEFADEAWFRLKAEYTRLCTLINQIKGQTNANA